MGSRAARFRFDGFVVDAARRTLSRGGKPVAVAGKAFDLLLVFVASEGAVLSRKDLYERLWPGGAVEDGNLSQTVHLLRRALDPEGDGRRYVETLPRYGYRFIQPVVDMGAVPGVPALQRLRAPALAAALVLPLLLLQASGGRPAAALSQRAWEDDAVGIYQLTLRNPRALRYAADAFRRTIREAPPSPAGYAGLATATALLAEFWDPGSRGQRAQVAAAKRLRDDALRRDPSDAQALAVSGFLAYRFDDDVASAEALLDRAVVADPHNADAHQWRGILRLARGNISAAVSELETARSERPASEVILRWLSRAYEFAGRRDDALRTAGEALRMEPDDAPAWLVVAAVQEQQGALRDAIATLNHLLRMDPYERPYVVADRARLELRLHGGNRRELVTTVDRLDERHSVDPFEAALFYWTAGLNERAITMLRKRPHVAVVRDVERHDPRVQALAESI